VPIGGRDRPYSEREIIAKKPKRYARIGTSFETQRALTIKQLVDLQAITDVETAVPLPDRCFGAA